MKVKRIKLYDGYVNINQEPTKWAFDSNILHLRKMGKNYYAKKRSKRNCAWCDSELIETEQQALKKESQHICYSCCQSDDEYYNTNKHLKKC